MSAPIVVSVVALALPALPACGGGDEAQSCGSLTFTGLCEGTVARWCDADDRPQSTDCANIGATCAYNPHAQVFDCLQLVPGEACDGLTFQGTCDGDVARWCEAQQVREDDCAAKGRVCAVNEAVELEGFHDCLERPAR